MPRMRIGKNGSFMVRQINWLRAAVFIGLFIMFLILGFSGVAFVSYRSNLKSIEQTNSHLNSIAKVAASNIDSGNLTNGNLELVSSLNRVQSSFPEVQNLTVFVQSNGQIFSVARSTGLNTNGWSPGDPIDNNYPEIKEIFSGATRAKSISHHQDRFGSWISGVAQITDSNGKVIGAIKADLPSESNSFWKFISPDLRVALAFTFAFSCGAAWLLTVFMIRKSERHFSEKQARSRKLFAEVFLVLLISGLIFDGGTAVINRKARQDAQSIATSKVEVLAAINKQLGTFYSSNNSMSLNKELEHKAKSLGLGSIIFGFPEQISLSESRQRLSSDILEATQAITNQLKNFNLQSEQEIYTQVRITLIAGLICAVALVIVRYASRRDDQIIVSQRRHLAIQKQYGDVVENLPVGLFTFQSAEFTFMNKEWNRQMSGLSESDLQANWQQSIILEDRDRTVNGLIDAEKSQSPFTIQYRVQNDKRQIRHLESRGIPVYRPDGEFSHLLGFTVDLTGTFKAKSALQEAYGEVERKNKLLATALGELEESLESMVRSFVKAVEAKDPYTAGHSERVMQYSVWLGKAIGLGPYELRILELGTLVHDVGKIGIPDAILTKPGRLTDEEYEVIKMHSEWGEQIISHIGLFKECLPIVRSHHERLNGMGYPDGLKDDEIGVLVRIAAIADIFDAMTSTRAYRKGMEVETVLQHMYEIAERGEIDAQLFTTFCQIIKERGIIPQNVEQINLGAA